MRWSRELHKFNSEFKNTSFMCPKDLFIKELKSNNPFINGAIQHLGFENLKVTNEIAYQNFDFLKKYENSKILIIGAGPSSDLNINEDEYDYIWSCNHFYKNEKINKLKISFVTLGNENNLLDPVLLEYLSNNDTIVCFENKYTNTQEMAVYKNFFPDKVFWAFTRYHSRIGSIPRLACIAASLGVKEIDFIGMDGYVPKKMRKDFNNSLFEPNKSATGTIEDSVEEEKIVQIYKQQYLVFWDYLLHDIGKEIKFKNLGHNHPCNLSAMVLKEKIGNDYQKYISDFIRGKNEMVD